MAKDKSFMFYETFLDVISVLPEEKRANACYEFCKYGITGELPQDESVAMFCIGVSASVRKYQHCGGNHNPNGKNQYNKNGQVGQVGQVGQIGQVQDEEAGKTTNRQIIYNNNINKIYNNNINNINNNKKENKNIDILVKESPLPDGQPTTNQFDRFVDWWNKVLIPVEDNINGNVVKIQVKSQKRKQMFKARWNDTKVYMRNQGMDVDDESAFVYMTEEVIGGNYVNSDWMRGKVKGNGYETGYRVEFDNIFTPKMWTGLLEKKYYNRSLDKVKYGS